MPYDALVPWVNPGCAAVSLLASGWLLLAERDVAPLASTRQLVFNPIFSMATTNAINALLIIAAVPFKVVPPPARVQTIISPLSLSIDSRVGIARSRLHHHSLVRATHDATARGLGALLETLHDEQKLLYHDCDPRQDSTGYRDVMYASASRAFLASAILWDASVSRRRRRAREEEDEDAMSHCREEDRPLLRVLRVGRPLGSGRDGDHIFLVTLD